MKLERSFPLIAALCLASCSQNPSSPTATPARTSVFGDAEAGGTAGANAITTTRMRLRRVGFGDIQTGLVTGQVISVPVNVNLDVWAEIVRLESDRARLVVDWGNGNNDFSGCGSCRLENTYTREGRYTLTAKVVDLNAPFGSEIVTLATVTIVVLPPPSACSAGSAGTDFETVAPSAPSPITVGGATYTSAASVILNYGASYVPVLLNQAFSGGGTTVTIAFASDKTTFSAGFAMNLGGTATYQALSANGAVVASGTISMSLLAPGVIGANFGFSAPPFTTVVINLGGSPGYAIDNVSASCN